MKKLVITSILALLLAGGSAMRAQAAPDEYLGLPGDNLNLYAVMKLFQESETIEAFERSLNDENSRINNLDLNGDNYVDYLTVSDYVDGNIHTIVLRATLSRNESQDVAVFTVEKLRNSEVRIQLIGDEALYGKNYIIEPNYAETPNPGYMGNNSNVTVVTTTYYDVAAWPVIRFMFHPAYVVWRSSWYWGYYPHYWNPWRPWYWHYYYGYHYNWYPHYYSYYHHHHHYHHYAHYHDHYYKHIRHNSPTVSAKIRGGQYKATYSRPDQRREGENLYARTYTGRRTNESTSYRSGTGSSVRQNTATTRRTTSTVNERSATNRSVEQRTTTSGRSTPAAVNRSTTRPSTTQRAITTQRPSSTPVNRTTTRPATTQRATTTQRSTQATVNRPATRSSVSRSTTAPRSSSSSSVSRSSAPGKASSVQRSSSARSSRSSAPAGRTISRSSSSKSSSSVSRSSSSSRSSSGSKTSGSNKSGRR